MGNLKVNLDKTEQTIIERGDKKTEKWRGVKKLGSLLGDTEDRSEEHTSELQSLTNLVCRLLLEKKKNKTIK